MQASDAETCRGTWKKPTGVCAVAVPAVAEKALRRASRVHQPTPCIGGC